MNQEKIDELTAGLAQALALVEKVRTAAYGELDYKFTRRAAHRAVNGIEELLVRLQDEWAADERELDEELEHHQRSLKEG
jgi:hypothetical protein